VVLLFLVQPSTFAVEVESNGQGFIKAIGSTGPDWSINQGHVYYMAAGSVNFDGSGFGVWQYGGARKDTTKTTKASSPTETDPSGGYGYGQAHVTTVAGYIWHDHKYQAVAVAHAEKDHSTKTQAEYIDPTSLTIGAAGTELLFTHDLSSGTQIQEPNINDPTGTPTTVLRGRFGIGEFNTGSGPPLPLVFWADPVPSEAFDLYRIEIFENDLGMIEAKITLYPSPSPDIELHFTKTETELVSAIETAGWNKRRDGIWELSHDVALIEVTVTNLNNNNLGELAAIGCCATSDAFRDELPIGLDIECDGQDLGVVVPQGTIVEVTIDVEPRLFSGVPVDIWVVFDTPFGWFSFDNTGPYSGWNSGFNNAYYTGPIADMQDTVFDGSLPVGSYVAYLAVDSKPNGVLDKNSLIHFDSVEIDVTQ